VVGEAIMEGETGEEVDIEEKIEEEAGGGNR
jgi:hypothetical protein